MATTETGTTPQDSGTTTGSMIVPQGPARLVLIAVTIAVVAQTLRFSAPLVAQHAETAGLPVVLGILLLVGLAGLTAPLIRRAAGPRGLLLAGVGGLFVIRTLAQAVHPRLWLAYVGTALAMLALVALYEGARGLSGVGFATATVAGLSVDTALRMAFATWDGVWQSGPGPWLACVAVIGLGVGALARELASGAVAAPGISWRDALGALAIGPFLALQILIFSSPAFVASAGWQSLYGAHIALIVGQGAALAFLASGLAVRAVPGGVAVLGGTLLGVGAGAVAGTYAVTGTAVVVVAVAGQVLAAWLLAVACRAPLRRSGRGGPVWRVDIGAALGGLLVVVLLVAYRLGNVESLPLPNNAVPGGSGLLLGGLAAIAAARGGPLPARAPLRAVTGGGLAVVLLVGTFLFNAGTPKAPPVTPSDTEMRVVTYNIRQAVNGRGGLDLEAAGDAIEAQRPDVVLLQEVARGSLASGTTDVGVWLSRRLGMHLIWGPAADNQFGNAILTSRPVRRSGVGRLPHGDWSQPRGYVWARLVVGRKHVEVWSTQLDEGADAAAGRGAQIAALLKAWGGGTRTIIGADLSAEPGATEVTQMQEGLRSAQVGGLTTPTTTGGRTVDWIFGTDDVIFSDVEVVKVGASDHFPVSATVQLRR